MIIGFFRHKLWVLLALPLLLTACYTGNQGGTRVAVVGDSITELTINDGYLPAALNPTYATWLSAFGGVTMARMFPVLETIHNDPEGPPAKWVIELGTADVAYNNLNWQADFNREVTFLQSASCIWLVTIATNLPSPSNNTVAATIDTTMKSWAAAHPNFHILDWGGWVDHHPAILVPDPELPDGVHPDLGGQQLLAYFELQALNSC